MAQFDSEDPRHLRHPFQTRGLVLSGFIALDLLGFEVQFRCELLLTEPTGDPRLNQCLRELLQRPVMLQVGSFPVCLP